MQNQVPVEYTVTHHDQWRKKLFVALCRTYDLRTYRYKGQKHTTVVVRLGPQLMDERVWPEYLKQAALMDSLVEEIVGELISKIGSTEEDIVADERIGQ